MITVKCPAKCRPDKWQHDKPQRRPGDQGLWIRTTCSACGRFIGWKPAAERK
jgi:hypothetical protein